MIDDRGNFTLEIVVVGMIILLILGIVTLATELSEEKISKSVENSNIEKTISEVCDSLINDPGVPINWEDFKSKRVGLAIINENEKVIPNSVSYFKFLELGRDYDRLVTKKLFDNKFHSSMELIPHETSISSVKIGNDEEDSKNVYSVNRVVKCDFYKKHVICDFLTDGKCNHNHNQKDYSCNYFKLFKGDLKKKDYYLLVDDNEKYECEYSFDTTHFKSDSGKTVSNTKIYLNDELKGLFEVNDTSSVVFIHFNKKDAKAVLVGVSKDFDKSKLNYNYFTTQPCQFIIKAWS
jgi:hypothetical protein